MTRCLFFFCSILPLSFLQAATVNVTTNASSGAGSLREAIFTIMSTGDASNAITFDPGLTITLSSPLPPIYLANTSDTLTITGNTTIIDGASTYRGLFVQRGTVALNSLTIQNCLARGGAGGSANTVTSSGGGGGGGAGLGGGLFVGNEAAVTATDLNFSATAATGGGGGSVFASTTNVSSGGAGGGGLHGSGGGQAAASRGGGGGGGYFGSGGVATDVSSGGGAGMFGNGASSNGNLGGGGGGGVEAGQNGSQPPAGQTGGTGGNGFGGTGGGAGGPAKTAGSPGAAYPIGGGGGGGGSSFNNDGPAADGGIGGFGGGGGGGGMMQGFDMGTDFRKGGGADGGLFGGGGGGGGAGGAGTAGPGLAGIGGSGGDYGGGGGSSPIFNTGAGDPQPGGDGGFGGGGGGAGAVSTLNGADGGTGGFGAGGGGSSRLGTEPPASGSVGGPGGRGGGSGGTGSTNQPGGGGGGGAFGGVIFVRDGGSLSIDSDLGVGTLTAGTAGTAGAGSAGQAGQTFGTSAFINGNSTLTFSKASGTQTVSGTIADDQSLTQGSGAQGNGAIAKTGGSTLVLSGTNTYTGGTTILGGVISISNDNNLGASSGPITLNGGTLQVGATMAVSRNFSIGASNGAITVDPTFTYTINGTVSGAGVLTKSGTGTITLTTDAPSLGGVTVSGGAFNLSANGALSGLLTLDAGTTFDITAISGASTTIGSLAGAAGSSLVITGKELIINQSASTTFGGVISGAGGEITKSGAGTLALSGMNTYGAGTNITAGVVAITEDANLGDGAGAVILNGGTLEVGGTFTSSRGFSLGSSNGTIQVDPTFTYTLSSAITGSGSLLKTGGGTLILSDTNGYGGATTISSGTLQLGVTDALPSTTSLTVDGTFAKSTFSNTVGQLLGSGSLNLGSSGTLTVDSALSSSFSGVITSSGGALTNTGGGSLTLTGNNISTFNGTLTNETGSTLVGNNLSLSANTVNDGALTWNQTALGTFSGIVNQTASGAFTKTGGGTLNFEGIFLQDTAVVNSGTLLVNTNAFTAGSGLTVNAGATLGGSGTITGPVINNGAVSPGNSIGTLNIIGNYTQAAGSELIIEINPTTSDQLLVTGDVTIEPGATLIVQPEIGTYNPQESYPIILANSVAGTFSTVTNSLPSLIFNTVYLPNGVYLNVNLVPFSTLGLSATASAVAACLDSASPAPGSDLEGIIDFLHFMNLSEIESTLDAMSPAIFSGLDLAQEETLAEVGDLFSFQMNRFCKSSCQEGPRMQGWVKYLGASQRQNSTLTTPGYRIWPQGMIAGFDVSWQENAFLGWGYGYSSGDISWMQGLGSGRIQNALCALYGGKLFSNQVYLQGAAAASANFYHTRRNIPFFSDEFTPFTRTAIGKPYGFSGLSGIEIGGFFKKERFAFRPFGKTTYEIVYRSSFKETDAESINLNVLSHTADLLRTNLALEASYCFIGETGTLSPSALFGGAFENRFMGKSQKAALSSTGCLIDVEGLFPNRYFFFAEASLVGTFFQDHLTLAGNVHYEWFKNYRTLSWLAELGLQF